MITHVTYQLTDGALHRPELEELMGLIGLVEVEPDDPFEHGYNVRWFRYAEGGPAVIHCVALEPGQTEVIGPYEVTNCHIPIGLGHFCVVMTPTAYRLAADSGFCERESGSGRAWLDYDLGAIRVEIRSS